jgi:hypothetical protein
MIFLLRNVPKPISTIPRRIILNGPWVIFVVIVENSILTKAKTDIARNNKPIKGYFKDHFIFHLHFHFQARTESASNKSIV